MKQNIEKEPEINPNIKLKDLYKYAQEGDSNKILEEISNPKRKKLINQYFKNKKDKNEELKCRYNNSLDKKILYLNNNNIESDYDYSENSESKNIFTRIKPYLNKTNDYTDNYYNNKDNEYDSKTNYNYKRRTYNKNAIYKRARTPDRKYTFYRKTKKKDSTDNTFSVSYYTESNNQNNISNIYDSLDENYKAQKPKDNIKKMGKIIKYGIKFELNTEDNNYIDLLTMDDIRSLENIINLKKLSKSRSPQQRKVDNNNIYIKKSSKNGLINLNKKRIIPLINNIKSRNPLNKTNDEDMNHKSYDCVTFKKKIGLNKRRKIRQKNGANSTDKYYNKLRREKGSPIKKENDKGGKIDFYPKLLFKNKGNVKINKLINMNKKCFNAAVIIQNWWKKYHINFIKKISLIQRVFRDYLRGKKTQKILKKKTTLKVIHRPEKITENNNKKNELAYKNNEEDNLIKNENNDNNINEEDIILIQRIFRQFLINKLNKGIDSNNLISYIPKEICEITKKRICPIKKKEEEIKNNNPNIDKNNKSEEKKTFKKSDINNIRTIKNINNNNNAIDNLKDKNLEKYEPFENKDIKFVKKHHYTKSKLSLSPLNKILISRNIVRYDTNRYTFLKKCYLRNREEDKEENEIYKASTTEYMRKVNLKLKGNYLTNKTQKKIINPSLQIDNLGEEANIQILPNIPDKDNKYKKNGDINENKLNHEKIIKLNADKNKPKNINDKDDINSNVFKKYNIIEKGKDSEEINDINKNKNNNFDIYKLVEVVTIPYQYITKCKMEEIIINNNKNKNEIKYVEEERVEKDEEEKVGEENEESNDKEKLEKEAEENKKLSKIILIQRNIKIFLEKIRPKITKTKKTILASQEIKKDIDEENIGNNYINPKEKTDNDNEIVTNLNNPEILNNPNNLNENLSYSESEKKYINNSEIEKKEDIISENSSIKGNLEVNETVDEPKNNNKENIIRIKINNERFINKSNDNGNNIINEPKQDINNESLDFIKKVSSKASNIINYRKQEVNNEEMIYINKMPNKANNIIKSTKNNNINDNTEFMYIKKMPSKAENLINHSNNKVNNEEMFYINKTPGKTDNLIKNINNNEEIINNIQEKNEESTSSINIDDTRNSCPIKEVKKLAYKKYKKDYLENLLKDNTFKFAINQLKEIGIHYKYFRFDYIVKMFVQKIQKINKQFVFLIIKGEGFLKHQNMYFDVIKTYLNNKNLYINDNNDVSNLLKKILPFYSNMYSKYKFIPYIKEDDENMLVNTQLFRRDENVNNLISFICNYLKIIKNTTNFSEDLIKYHLTKYPIKNFNIFGLTRYINLMHHVLIFSHVNIKDLKNKDNVNLSYININNNNKGNELNDITYKECIELNKPNDVKNKKYIRKTINYNKAKKISMKRHVINLSSCDINNNSYENTPNANDSLIKKSIIK